VLAITVVDRMRAADDQQVNERALHR